MSEDTSQTNRKQKEQNVENTMILSRNDYWIKSIKSRPLLLMKSFGRLGNQIFHYAVGFCVALKTHRTPTVSRHSILFNLFPHISAYQLEHKINLDDMNWKFRVGEMGHSTFNHNLLEQVKKSNRTWLTGCFQSWKYLIGCEKIIRSELKFNLSIQADVNNYMKEIASTYTYRTGIYIYDVTFIGVHVRRGDYLRPDIVERGYVPAPISYIHDAMNYYRSRYKWPLFIIASEEIDWCKQNINYSTYNDVVFSSYTKSLYMHDFVLLSLCNHSIMTVGSYGWFSSWFAGGEVVYYNQPFKSGSRMSKGLNMSDRYPQSWIPMN